MSYSTSIVNLPLGGSCQDRHDEYAAEKARVSQLAAQLGQEAARCHKLHGDFDSASAKHATAAQERARCKQKHQEWAQRKAAYDAYLIYKEDCDKYRNAKRKYASAIRIVAANNAKKKADWEEAVAKVKAYNYSVNQAHAGAIGRYTSAMTTWKKQKEAYQSYRSAVAAQSYGLSMTWESTQRSNPDYFRKYNWTFLTGRCGSNMRCVTKNWKQHYELKCTGVQGLGAVRGALGATPTNATACQYYYHYPVCPESCPPGLATDPGDPPTKPADPVFKSAPPEPKYTEIPQLNDFLDAIGVKKMPDDCASAGAVPDPGKKPSCNPTAPLPVVPPKPTCTPPEIPPMPIEPACKPSVFGQVGSMWLLLAAGGVGLYWLAKKK